MLLTPDTFTVKKHLIWSSHFCLHFATLDCISPERIFKIQTERFGCFIFRAFKFNGKYFLKLILQFLGLKKDFAWRTLSILNFFLIQRKKIRQSRPSINIIKGTEQNFIDTAEQISKWYVPLIRAYVYWKPFIVLHV